MDDITDLQSFWLLAFGANKSGTQCYRQDLSTLVLVKIGSIWTVPLKVSLGCLEAVSGLWELRMSCMLIAILKRQQI